MYNNDIYFFIYILYLIIHMIKLKNVDNSTCFFNQRKIIHHYRHLTKLHSLK